MALALAFNDVSKRYRNADAVLDGVSFDVADGETVALVGVNGAGKSTLLKIALDLMQPSAGGIKIFGIPHVNVSARAPVAYLPENFQPPHFASGYDILRYLSRLHGVSFSDAGMQLECTAMEFDAGDLRRPSREYSKGMRQKLGLIACLLVEPRCFILDEPMSGLDPKARALFRARLQGAQSEGRAILFTTHLLDDVVGLCRRLVVLDRGQICYDGSVADMMKEFAETSLESAFLRCLEVHKPA